MISPTGNKILQHDHVVNTVLNRLDGVKQTRSGYKALCPAHDDRHPSLSIREAEDGRTLLRCWAGCPTAVVVAALGLTWADLFPARPEAPTRRRTKAERQKAARQQVETVLERRFHEAEARASRDLAAMICAVNTALSRGGWEAIMQDVPDADDLAALAHWVAYWEYLADELMRRNTDADTKIAAFLAVRREVAAWQNVALKYSNS